MGTEDGRPVWMDTLDSIKRRAGKFRRNETTNDMDEDKEFYLYDDHRSLYSRLVPNTRDVRMYGIGFHWSIDWEIDEEYVKFDEILRKSGEIDLGRSFDENVRKAEEIAKEVKSLSPPSRLTTQDIYYCVSDLLYNLHRRRIIDERRELRIYLIDVIEKLNFNSDGALQKLMELFPQLSEDIICSEIDQCLIAVHVVACLPKREKVKRILLEEYLQVHDKVIEDVEESYRRAHYLRLKQDLAKQLPVF